MLIKLDEIFFDEKFNCRGDVTPESVEELADSFREMGQLQEIVVSDSGGKGKKYKLLLGHRRFRAAQALNWTEINANVKSGLTLLQEVLINATENIQRVDLSFFMEAKVVLNLRNAGLSELDIAQKLARSRTWVRQRLQLMELPEQFHEMADLGILKSSHMAELSQIETDSGRHLFLRKIKSIYQDHFKVKDKIDKIIEKRVEAPNKPRSKKQIEELHDLLYTVFGPNVFATGILPWTLGLISTDRLYDLIADEALLKEVPFIRPALLPENAFAT